VTSPYTHSGLSAGTTYYYVATAVSNTTESAASNEASATAASSSSGGGGGGCTLNPQAAFDPTFILMLLASGLYLRRRNKV